MSQSTAFTYQGQLNSSGAPANGIYDLRFAIYDAPSAGNLLGGPLTNSATALSNGCFTAQLDFGSGVFNGGARWIEIGVRTNGAGVFTILSPRQPVTSTPYAIQSANATVAASANSVSATNISGSLSVVQLPLAVITNGATGVSVSGTFTGNGAGLTNLNLPGAFTWQTVSGTIQQAAKNTGYIVTNNTSLVTITLPSSANIGDVVAVTGAGAGGWKIAQNNGQSILSANLAGSIGLVGQDWISRDIARTWTAIASSADGSKLIAVTQDNIFYTSKDSGVTWQPQYSDATNFAGSFMGCIASSADGTKIVAAAGNGYVFNSIDSGVTWSKGVSSPTNTGTPFNENTRLWTSVASSADGAKLYAANSDGLEWQGSNGGMIYASTDSGATWTYLTNTPLNLEWRAIATSADGTKVIAGDGQQMCVSYDSGATWTVTANPPRPYHFALSADGTKLVASTADGYDGIPGQIYTSSVSEISWTLQTNSPPAYWATLACSAYGTRIVGAANSGRIYTSTDSGVTWTGHDINRAWQAVASSADGTKLVAAVMGDHLFTSDPVPVPTTTTGTAGGLTGAQNTTIQLQYVGNGQWLPISHEGSIYEN